MTFIPIDRATVRRNPDYHPGIGRQFAPDGMGGGIEVTSMHGSPLFLYRYQPAQVTCRECGASFDHDDLASAEVSDGDGGENYSTEVCPRCHAFDCCDVEYERLSSSELERLAEAAHADA